MRWKKRGFLAVLLLAVLMGCSHHTIYAKSGKIYTCTITRCYEHPVTGVIEDAGGKSSCATGQGMVESAVAATGLLEVTEEGEYYLTVRCAMMDYTTGHSFLVQNTGDSTWMSTTAECVAQGTENGGSTADFRIQVSGESCIVRCSMTVTPMGRDVIFYFYPGGYTEENSSGMTAGVVTEQQEVEHKESTAEQQEAEHKESTAEQQEAERKESTAEQQITDSSQTFMESNAEDSNENTAENERTGKTGAAEVQGLSLSTAGETYDTAENADATTSTTAAGTLEKSETQQLSVRGMILLLTVSATISGLILLAAAAGLVYYFRKNWKRWGEAWDEEED